MTADNDSFEQSLRSMLATEAPVDKRRAALQRVLKTANRQIGAGAIFSLFARNITAVMIGLDRGSAHLKPVSRLSNQTESINKAD